MNKSEICKWAIGVSLLNDVIDWESKKKKKKKKRTINNKEDDLCFCHSLAIYQNVKQEAKDQ